jgi:type IV pilus assembly protein PilA
MKKNNKGFTLIELLVVVAIIGILAAVGVVAYSGYTSGAKKSAVKSNQAAIIKYVAAELKKCELGETNVMSTKLKCDDRKNGSKVADGVSDALGSEFKNPYKTSETAVVTTAIADCKKTDDEGRTSVTDDGTTVTVKSCTKKDETILSGTVTIE